mmetsp:Transcript_12747/g.21987  ORF Transcript_12747/g.21987 Transcript_12747/m.21987 type:complete len:207 (-) Transcript_12747:180-800(-)
MAGGHARGGVHHQRHGRWRFGRPVVYHHQLQRSCGVSTRDCQWHTRCISGHYRHLRFGSYLRRPHHRLHRIPCSAGVQRADPPRAAGRPGGCRGGPWRLRHLGPGCRGTLRRWRATGDQGGQWALLRRLCTLAGGADAVGSFDYGLVAGHHVAFFLPAGHGLQSQLPLPKRAPRGSAGRTGGPGPRDALHGSTEPETHGDADPGGF